MYILYFVLVLNCFLYVVSGYQKLASAGETPTVGSDYLLEALDDFKYDMSFMVHISQGTTPLNFCLCSHFLCWRRLLLNFWGSLHYFCLEFKFLSTYFLECWITLHVCIESIIAM